MGGWDWCPWKYTLAYVLGMKDVASWKAERGNMVHKALELLAHRKVCEQEGRTTFTEPEVNREFTAADITVNAAVDIGFEYYAKKNETGRAWSKDDREECRKNVWHLVNYNDGMFSPLNRKIVCPEKYFDLTIDEPWAQYSFTDPHTGQQVTGQLAIKGSIDLVTEVSQDTLEYIDYKTGKRLCWKSGVVKDYKKLCSDPQLLLYYYALTRIFPEYKQAFVSIFYTADGGPFTVLYEKEKHVPFALEMLRRKFFAIKNTMLPRRIIGDAKHKWKCERLCSFYANKWEGTDKSQCDYLYEQTVEIGLDRVIAKHGRKSAWNQYGSGGGQSNREGGE